ncbi:MAG: hypothetical protein KAZ88_06945 [Acidimicrobiia bacterium]|nr:hypothetical protein [Acidimicrobiia bacterium]MBP8180711.1 hypothetical protein [Acidimicrobiia bacterium]
MNPPQQLMLEGEHTATSDRAVISPEGGLFHATNATKVLQGDTLGTIDRQGRLTEVVAPVSGTITHWFVLDTERVRSGQPVAWITVGE